MARPFALACALVTLAGCTSRVLPLSAQAGSTVALAVGGDATLGDRLGYGGAWLAASGVNDDQRGELVFVLVPPSGAERTLRTLFVTRTFPDPASDAALANQIDPALPFAAGLSQALAVLEIPADTPPGRYRMDARRRRPAPGGGFVSLPAPLLGTELDVLPPAVGSATGRPNAPELAVGTARVDLAAEIPRVVPNPKLVVQFADRNPAAAHLVLSYPREKLAIGGVFEEQHSGRRSILSWRDDPSRGELAIDFVDPAGSVRELGVAFRLLDPSVHGIAAPGDFRVAQADLYDARGALAPGRVRVDSIR
jgi:hypothetical protein